MQMTIYDAATVGSRSNCVYPNPVTVTDADTMRQAAADTLRTDDERAQAFYNLGNAQFKQQKYKEALESYKQSLRLNPSDQEAKYNYAYTKRLLQKQQNEDQNKDQNKDQQNSGGQDQNQDKKQG